MLDFPHALKIGMALGTTEAVSLGTADFFGFGANEGARVQGQAAEGQILINDNLFNALGRQWGHEKRDKYLASIGDRPQKGLHPEEEPGGEPGKKELYQLDWRSYSRDYPETGLQSVVTTALEEAGVSLADFALGSDPGLVVWPVVPRRRVTAIHRAQAQLIKLLCLLGWEPILLVADCSSPRTADSKVDSAKFRKELMAYCKKVGFSLTKVELLSSMWGDRKGERDKLQDIFQGITSELSFEDLQMINSKQQKYDPKDIAKVNKRPTLDNLRPALSGAAVALLASDHDGTTVVVAGSDEAEQWRRIVSSTDTPGTIGRAMIPILMVDRRYIARQHGEFSSWDAWKTLQGDLEAEQGNLASWVFHCHVLLPAFPAKTVRIGDKDFGDGWECEETVVPEGLGMKDLARVAWNTLGPT